MDETGIDGHVRGFRLDQCNPLIIVLCRYFLELQNFRESMDTTREPMWCFFWFLVHAVRFFFYFLYTSFKRISRYRFYLLSTERACLNA